MFSILLSRRDIGFLLFERLKGDRPDEPSSIRRAREPNDSGSVRHLLPKLHSVAPHKEKVARVPQQRVGTGAHCAPLATYRLACVRRSSATPRDDWMSCEPFAAGSDITVE